MSNFWGIFINVQNMISESSVLSSVTFVFRFFFVAEESTKCRRRFATKRKKCRSNGVKKAIKVNYASTLVTVCS